MYLPHLPGLGLFVTQVRWLTPPANVPRPYRAESSGVQLSLVLLRQRLDHCIGEGLRFVQFVVLDLGLHDRQEIGGGQFL